MKYALALSGGGANGAFHVGAIKAFHEAGIKFDMVAGVSAGAFVGTQANNWPQLEKMWGEIAGKPEKFFTPYFTDYNFKIKPWQIVKRLPGIISGGYQGLACNKPLAELIRRFVHYEDLPPNYRCGVVSLDTGKYESLSLSDFPDMHRFREAILASTAMTPFWGPVKELTLIDRKIYNASDGGSRTILPLWECENFIYDKPGAWTVISVSCRSGSVGGEFESNNIFSNILRVDEIKNSEIFNNDRAGSALKDYPLINIRPCDNVYIPKKWDFSQISMDYMNTLGYSTTKTAIESHQNPY